MSKENTEYINDIIIITPHDASNGCIKTINKLINLYPKKLKHKFRREKGLKKC